MSLKENQIKNYSNQRATTPHQRFVNSGNSIQAAPMNAYQQPMYAPPMQQAPVQGRIHSLQHIPISQPPVAYPSMGGQPNSHVFSSYGNVSTPPNFSYPHGRIQTVYFQPQNIATPSSGLRYTMPHQMQTSAPVEQLGLQQQIPTNHVPFSTAQHQPQTAKQERPKSKKIIIRDPNQGGKDVTNEILSRKKSGPPATAAVATATATDTGTQSTNQQPTIGETFRAQVTERRNDKNFVISESPAKDSKDTEKDRELKEGSEVLPEETPSQLNDVKLTTDVSEDNDSLQSANIENPTVEKEPPVPETNDISNADASSTPIDSTEAVPVTDADRDVQTKPNVVSDKEIEGSTINTIENENSVPLDESNGKDDEPVVADAVPAEVGEEKVSQKELEPLEVTENETTMLNETSTVTKEDNLEGNSEAHRNEDSPSDMIANDKANEDDITASLMLNGVEKPVQNVAIQVKKKKKGKYKERDPDMMSAFVDKQEDEGNTVTPDDEVEPEQMQEDEIKEETWEDKDIKAEDEPPKSDRICYDRSFLLGFQHSKEKPKGLPNIEPVLSEAHEPTKPLERGRLQSSGGGVDFMPTFMQKGSTGRPIGMSRSGKGGRAPAMRKIIPTNFEAKVELKKSDNAWVRPSEASKELSNDEREKAELLRKARGILNKLTPQKFEKLVDMMKSLQINTADKLKGVIDLIFEKALSEPSFSKAYAQLCDALAKQKMQIENGSNMTFKRILLNKCQAEFEKEKTDEQQLEKEQDKHFENAEEEKAWQEELAMKRHLTKRRSLGNIRFIGELFKLKMLTEAIMHTCLCKLIKDRDEESLECLCQLLTTIGKDIDHEKAKPRTDQYFQQIEKIINQKKVSSRIIFMLKDVRDLRATKWVSRRATDAPKTIAEIHEEAKQEEIQMQLAHQQAAQKRMNNKGGGRDSPSLSRTMQNDDGWNQVQSKGGRSTQPVDPSRLKITKRTDSDNISLGPGGRPGAWAQGASGGGSSRFLPGDGESRQGNRFSALSGGEPGNFRQEGKGRLGLKGQSQLRFGRAGGMAGSGRRQQHQLAFERAAAIENVKKLLSSEGQRSVSPPSSSQQKGGEYDAEDSTTTVESNDVTVQSDVSGLDDTEKAIVDEVSDEKVKNETKMTIEEYLCNRDLKEAELCIRELKCTTKYHILVSEAINIAIEKKLVEGQLIGELLHGFVRSGLISLEAFKLGLADVLEFAEDIAVDIPHIWTNLGGLLGPAVEGETLPLSDLKTLIEPLIQCNKAGLLMAEILAAAAKRSNESAISRLWQRSGLAWEKFLPEGSDLQAFMAKHKMEFTIQGGDTNLEQRSLRSLCQDASSTVEMVIEWVQGNIPAEHQRSLEFLRELSTSIFNGGFIQESSGFNSSQIRKYGTLLSKHVDSDKNKEVEILYAGQLLADELKHPKDFLREIFEALYDEEIISEESVNIWVDSKVELAGKGNALSSVKGFLDWLNSGHDENKR